jgi:DNA-binding FadR family transcriptional regulator
MIATLEMRRITLRKALDALELEGAIWRHVGKGTFVAHSSGGHGAFADLKQKMSPVRMVQARLCIESSLAREAAINASREAIIRINHAKNMASAATNWTDYENQDDAFHRAIAAASDNALLLLIFDQLNHIRRAVADTEVIRGSSRPPRAHSSFDEHEAITQAIEVRDPVAAQKAMRFHIESVAGRLFGRE